RPLMPWLEGQQAPKAPYFIDAFERPHGLELYWADNDTSHRTRQYVLYRFDSSEVINLKDPTKILSILPQMPDPHYTDAAYVKGRNYVYVVTALDRLQNESLASDPLRMEIVNGRTRFLFP